MKVSAVLVFVSLWLIHQARVANGEYRFRRLPPPPRPMSSTQFQKKWSNVNQRQSSPNRPQRMPPPMHPHFKKPLGPPHPPPPPRTIPAKIVPIRLSQIQVNVPPPPARTPNQNYRENAFLSAPPTVKLPEYDFHLQTNQIPNHSNLIKQVDEKGPIHTIPAPNLSLADKPAHIEEVKPKVEKPYQLEAQQYQAEIQKAQQYQAEVQKAQQYQAEVQKAQQYQVEVQKAQQYQVTEAPEPPKKIYRQEVYLQEKQNQEPEPSNQEQELYKVLQNLPQGYQILPQAQLVQQSYIQQYYPQDPSFLSAIPQKDFHPEYLTFNYEEPTIKPTEEVLRFPAESDFITTYFENREVQDTNNVETPESAKPIPPHLNEELIAGSYYSSLPNKQVADTLASLQAAGKQNSKKENNNNNNNSKMTIYVPDDFGEDKSYEEAESDVDLDNFGSRIKPKKY